MTRRRTPWAIATAALLLAGCAVPGAAPTTPAPPMPAAPSTAPSAAPSTPTPTTGPADDDASDLFVRTRAELLDTQRTQGTRAALALLERRIASDPAIAGVCHAIAHELGHEAVEQAGGDVREALKVGSEVCGGGFTHGAVEVVLGASAHPARDLLRVCAPQDTGSCFHGVGHGLMFATGMDVRRSLQLCDRSPTEALANRCGEGVFMQLFSSDLSAQHVSGTASLDVASDPDAALAECRGTRARYAPNCWFYAPTVWLTVRPDDFSGALTWCRSAGSPAGTEVCARGVGSRTVKYHPDDLGVGSAVCATAGRLTDACLQGMGSYWSVHHEGRVPPSDVCDGVRPRALAERCRSVV